MATERHYANQDYAGNQLLSMVLESIGSNPGTPFTWQVWVNTSTNRITTWDGSTLREIPWVGEGGGGGVETLTVNSPLTDGGTASDPDISLDSTAINEIIDDRVAALLVAGTGVTLTYNDGAGTLTVSLTSSVLGSVKYLGTWNATTNSPTITGGAGTKGDYYVVSTAGATSIDGITDWKIGDWIIYNGTAWEKVDNTDAVTSVAGRTGAVTLGVADVSGAAATANNLSDLASASTARTNLGLGSLATRVHYSALIGSGSPTTFTITQATHGCAASRELTVCVYDVTSDEQVYPSIKIASSGDVTVAFTGVVPATNQFRVVIRG